MATDHVQKTGCALTQEDFQGERWGIMCPDGATVDEHPETDDQRSPISTSERQVHVEPQSDGTTAIVVDGADVAYINIHNDHVMVNVPLRYFGSLIQ